MKNAPAYPTQPTLIFIRHAARDFTGDRLSAEGQRQAARLTTVLTELGLPRPDRLESSPKNRTQATLRFLANEMQREVTIDARLDERNPGEIVEIFEERVAQYLDACTEWALRAKPSTVPTSWLACSHLDWLEEAVLRLSSDESDLERSEPWAPLAIRGYVFDDGIWKRIITGTR